MTGLASQLAERPPWLARFPHRHGGSAVGAGVLIGPQYVVTCAHVVEQQLGRPLPAPGPNVAVPPAEVEFPFADNPGVAVTRMRCTVVGWVPIAADGSGDAVLLELEAPVGLVPAPLACPALLDGHRFSVHGFPHGDLTARHAVGVLRGASGQEGRWVQLDAEGPTGWMVEVGFSGAPVFDRTAEAVVGIIVMRDDPRTRAGHMLPMSALRVLWPEVRRHCRWRLDLDASYHTHWNPRAHGSELDSDTGEWFFTGRVEARRTLSTWLASQDPIDHPVLLVTGGPGSGKSALLAHSLVAADPLLGSLVPTSGPRPPTGSVDVALHLRGRTRADVTAQLASAFGVIADEPDKLLAEVNRFPPSTRLCVLADAADEASSLDEALRIATLLRQLAATGRVRVLASVRTAPVGARRARILATFGRSAPRIDLDDYRYLNPSDVISYVMRRLASETAGAARYREFPPEQLVVIGAAVARKARYNFLIAQLTSGWLARRSARGADPVPLEGEDELPETVGQAMDAYLDTCGPDTATVRRLLTALAYARGGGLPRGSAWLSMAGALGFGVDHTARDLERIFEGAAHYLVERTSEERGPHTYRLFHDALDQHLREECERAQTAPEAAITVALTDAVPTCNGQRDWAAADPYTRDHLADHAAASGRLDALLDDAGYLVHATPRTLAPYLRHDRPGAARLTAMTYRASAHLLRDLPPQGRRGLLAIDSARFGDIDLSARLAQAGPWRVRWATGSTVDPALTASMTRYGANAVACTMIEGRPHAVCLGDLGSDPVYVWDLENDEPRAELPIASGAMGKSVVACTDIDGRPHAITARYNNDGVRVWDLEDGTLRATLMAGRSRHVGSLACAYIDGHPHALVGVRDRVHVWDLIDNVLRAELPAGRMLACTDIDGRPHALLNGEDGVVSVWDLTGPTLRCDLRTSGVRAMAFAVIGGRPHVVSSEASGNGILRVRDLDSGTIRAEMTVSNHRRVIALDCVQIDGRPHAVTVGDFTDVVRIWDLENRAVRRELRTGNAGGIEMIRCTIVHGRPHAITSGMGRGARMWDLTADAQRLTRLNGHRGSVTALACINIGGRPHAVSGGADHLDDTMRVWDLTADWPDNERATVATGNGVDALACIDIDGRPHALASDRLARGVAAWDMSPDPPLAVAIPPDISARETSAIACTLIERRPHAVLAGYSSMSVWDLTAGLERAVVRGTVQTGHPDRVTSLVCAIVDGRPHAITSCWRDETVWIWDLTTVDEQQPVRTALRTGHHPGVRALSCAVIDGHPHLVTGGNFGGDGKAVTRVWDLTAGTGQPPRVTFDSGPVRALACTVIDGRPYAVTSGFNDDPVHVWDLTVGTCVETIPVPLTVGAIAASGPLIVLGMGGDLVTVEWTGTGALRP